MRLRQLLTVSVPVLVLAAAAIGLWWRFFAPVPVTLVPVSSGVVPLLVVGPGTVQARVPVTLSARITSTIVELNADVGDRVGAGQLLVRLDDRDLLARQSAIEGQQASLERQIQAAAAAVAKARADLELARTRRNRDAQLQVRGFISQASLDVSNANMLAARAGLEGAEATLAARRADRTALAQEARLARTQLSYSQLTAPMDAIVTQRLAEPGTTVVSGTPILKLVDPATLWVAARIDESIVARISPGQPATIRLRSGQILSGRVARIALQSDAATRELEVHVAFEQPPARIAIDQEAEVRIDTGTVRGLVVPVEALVQDRKGRQGVLRVVDGRASFAPLTAGPAGGGKVLVRDGLNEGEPIVADPRDLKAGMRVQPLAGVVPAPER